MTAPLELAELVTPEDLQQAAGLFATVWGTALDNPPVSRELLRALAHTGNYVAGARAGSRLVGASVGFFANDGETPKLHSHITGLAPDAQRKGIGFALKCHQRAWALGRALSTITWTFDPLVRRNAYFNLTKLAARATAFHVNFYGAMADCINAGDETDRCEITWDLDDPATQAACEGSIRSIDLDALLAAGAVMVLEDAGDGTPRARPMRGDVRLCWIPEDIVALRATAPDVARAWRLALRETLGASVAAGFFVTGMTRSGWYVVERAS